MPTTASHEYSAFRAALQYGPLEGVGLDIMPDGGLVCAESGNFVSRRADPDSPTPTRPSPLAAERPFVLHCDKEEGVNSKICSFWENDVRQQRGRRCRGGSADKGPRQFTVPSLCR
jgi:hypothetical protein